MRFRYYRYGKTVNSGIVLARAAFADGGDENDARCDSPS